VTQTLHHPITVGSPELVADPQRHYSWLHSWLRRHAVVPWMVGAARVLARARTSGSSRGPWDHRDATARSAHRRPTDRATVRADRGPRWSWPSSPARWRSRCPSSRSSCWSPPTFCAGTRAAHCSALPPSRAGSRVALPVVRPKRPQHRGL
jgi:hypothetical protein